MSYALSHNAFACLKAQTNLTGQFTHILRDESNGARAKQRCRLRFISTRSTS